MIFTLSRSPADFNARFLAWALAKAQEAGLLRGTALTPPSVWALDGGLDPGAFALVSYACFMIFVIVFVWVTVEFKILRRILVLTRRSAEISSAIEARRDLGELGDE